MKNGNARRQVVPHLKVLLVGGVFAIIAVVVALPAGSLSARKPQSAVATLESRKSAPTGLPNSSVMRSWSTSPTATLALPPTTADIETFAADCTTPKTTFNLGDTVCAKATGLVGYRFAWVDPAGYVEQRTAITTDPQTDTFILPASQTSVVNTVTVDNRGQWRVNVITSRGSVRTATFSTVKDPQNAAVDLSITKTLIGEDPSEGGPVQFTITVKNNGPDDAASVHFLDNTFSNATLNSVTQTDGPAFVCTGSGAADCTIATMANGDAATFVLNFTAGTAGTILSNTATISSATAEQNPTDNTYTTADLKIGSAGSGATCILNCPNNINALANTTESSQRGAHVTFDDPTTSGSCGTVTASPASGSFFPVGTTTVVFTSDQGGGSCSFTITVTDNGSNPPTISCPGNQSANADSNCSANIAVGTATATGDNVTIFATRSDGSPLYTCDANGTNCTRNSTDAPFSTGVTTITWVAYSHDVAGPYADADTEEAHRTGSASCTQTITVVDVTPPTISAANQTASADANCLAPVPDFSTIATVSDNCACASSDASQICDSRQDIVISQSPAPGTLVGLGAHTITLSANDGSSNNGGTGNTTTITVTFTVNDTTPPTFTFVPPAASGSTGAGATSCDTVVDPGQATASDNCGPVTVTRSPSGNTFPVGTTTITWTATDGAGNTTTATQTVTVTDNTPPVISCPANVTVYLPLNTTATSMAVTYPAATATDNCGVAGITYSAASGSVFPVGTTPVTATATDVHGNSSSCTFTITVLYDFTGFFSPVNNPPTLNIVNAGRAIPVKFSLSGNKGLNIFAVNSPVSGLIPCDASAPATDLTDTVTAGGSSLSYDASSDQYIYIWKTDSSWAGTCRQLLVTLNDGSVHVANFKFR